MNEQNEYRQRPANDVFNYNYNNDYAEGISRDRLLSRFSQKSVDLNQLVQTETSDM